MSITVNGQSRVPPGFRFHPTEEELLNYYLRKKVACEKIDLDVIRDVDLNKLEPWDIEEKCRIGSTPQNDWYFFSHKDKKYPTGTRTNRATAAGFWKATGRDKVIHSSCRRIGMRKTLVFYRGRAPHGQKSDWIMHEYRLDDHTDSISQSNESSSFGETLLQEEGWVVCRVFKKKNYHKAGDHSPKESCTITNDLKTTTISQVLHPSSDHALDQILQYMGRSCKQESDNINSTCKSIATGDPRYLLPVIGTGLHDRFMKLPALESPTLPSLPTAYTPSADQHSQANYQHDVVGATVADEQHVVSDWAALDRLVASQLNGQTEQSRQLSCFDEPGFVYSPSSPNSNAAAIRLLSSSSAGGDGDLWSFARSVSSSSDLCSLSQSPI